jgi:choline-sulfatase
MSNNRPNILLIMTDEHAPDVTGYAGDPLARTQNLDRLAARSVQFDTAVCAVPVCTPSRMCMLTGKEGHRVAGWNNHWIIFPEHRTWPEHFAEHGYRTCLVGKMHFGGRDQMQGFQLRPYGDLRHGVAHQAEPLELFPGYHGARSAGVSEIPESLMQDVVVTRESLAFARDHAATDPDTPWFLCASYGRPHPPFTTPARYHYRYQGKSPKIQLPANERDRLDPYARSFHDGAKSLTDEEIQAGRDGYYACVDFVDDLIGELLDGLERDGLLENTIVIYTADHGEMLGRHGIWGKCVYFDPSICVPLLISGPGIAAGHHVVEHPISLMDLFPTTCALAGLPLPREIDGVDFSAVLADPGSAPAPRQYAPSLLTRYSALVHLTKAPNKEGDPYQAFRCVRDARWNYVDVEGGSPLLFDLQSDPDERNNLADLPEHAERCRQMREALFDGFSWEGVHAQLAADRARLPEHMSGQKPSTPNQYMFPDGRVFDAEKELYDARWLRLPDERTGSIIPQRFG